MTDKPVDLLAALAESLGIAREDLTPSPPDRRSSHEIEREDRMIDREISRREDRELDQP